MIDTMQEAGFQLVRSWLTDASIREPPTVSVLLAEFGRELVSLQLSEDLKLEVQGKLLGWGIEASRTVNIAAEAFRTANIVFEFLTAILPEVLKVLLPTRAYVLARMEPYDFHVAHEVCLEAGNRFCQDFDYPRTFQEVLDDTYIESGIAVEEDNNVLRLLVTGCSLCVFAGALPNLFTQSSIPVDGQTAIDHSLNVIGNLLAHAITDLIALDMPDPAEELAQRIVRTTVQ